MDSLVKAIQILQSYEWDGTLSLQPYGTSGDSFAYSFHAGYIITFRRQTDRDWRKQPVCIHLYLKTIQKTP